MKNFYEHYGNIITRISYLDFDFLGRKIANKLASSHFKGYFDTLLQLSYLKKFLAYGKTLLNNNDPSITLTKYAIMLNNKAHELLTKAAFNKDVNLSKLQKEILSAGKSFIHEYAVKRIKNKGLYRGKRH